MTLDELLAAAPRMHVDGAGTPHSWQLSDDALRFLDAHVHPGSRTLEVGAGVSTILFAIKRTRHLAIVPSPDEVSRIVAWCAAHGIETDGLRFEVELSERCLPRLEIEPLDLVLIDGAHGFPIPFIDWFYTAPHLRPGGHLLIDDTQVWTGHVLKAFLEAEPEWQLVADFAPRAAAFRKLVEGGCGKNEWQQPYVVEQSVAALRFDQLEVVRGFAPDARLDAEKRRRRSLRYRLARRLG